MAGIDEELLKQLLQTAGPAALPQIQRSAYLSQALDQINRSANDIRSPAALGANLGAVLLTKLAQRKEDKRLADAMTADARTSSQDWSNLFHPPGATASVPSVAPPTPPTAPAPTPPAHAMANLLDPKDEDAAIRTVWGEARGEGAPGQQAVAGVIANRAKMAGLPISQIVAQPHQFAGFNPQAQALDPNSPQYQAIKANIDPVLMGQTPSPAGTADHFYAPRGMPGGRPPSWAAGQPQQPIGNQNFLSLGFGGQPPMQVPPQGAPPMAQNAPTPQAMQGQPGAFQVASNGPPSPMGAPPPASAPPGLPSAGTPPPSGQPGGGGGLSQARGLGSITPETVQYVGTLLSSANPQERARGAALRDKLLYEATQSIEWKDAQVNGVPMFYDPQNPQHTQTVPIPEQAMTHNRSAQDLNINAPQGTVFNVGPFGQTSTAFQPPPGYQMQSGGAMAPVQGGQYDPNAPQNRNTPIPHGPGSSDLPAGSRGYVDATGKPTVTYSPSDTEKGKVAFTYRALMANQSLNDMASKGVFKPTMNNFWQQFLGGNDAPQVQALMTDQDRQLYQAAEAFAYPFLRKESGAVISPSEIRQTMGMLLPLPTDDDTTLWQKASRRADVLKAMEAETGGTFTDTYPNAPKIHALGPTAGYNAMHGQHQPARQHMPTYNPATGNIE